MDDILFTWIIDYLTKPINFLYHHFNRDKNPSYLLNFDDDFDVITDSDFWSLFYRIFTIWFLKDKLNDLLYLLF